MSWQRGRVGMLFDPKWCTSECVRDIQPLSRGGVLINVHCMEFQSTPFPPPLPGGGERFFRAFKSFTSFFDPWRLW